MLLSIVSLILGDGSHYLSSYSGFLIHLFALGAVSTTSAFTFEVSLERGFSNGLASVVPSAVNALECDDRFPQA